MGTGTLDPVLQEEVNRLESIHDTIYGGLDLNKLSGEERGNLYLVNPYLKCYTQMLKIMKLITNYTIEQRKKSINDAIEKGQAVIDYYEQRTAPSTTPSTTSSTTSSTTPSTTSSTTPPQHLPQHLPTSSTTSHQHLQHLPQHPTSSTTSSTNIFHQHLPQHLPQPLHNTFHNLIIQQLNPSKKTDLNIFHNPFHNNLLKILYIQGMY